MDKMNFEQKALDLVEKRVRCANLSYMAETKCKLNCAYCQYRLGENEGEEYAEALEFVWKTAKYKLESRESAAEEKTLCKYISPCGLCDRLSDAFSMPTKCTERGKNNARNS